MFEGDAHKGDGSERPSFPVGMGVLLGIFVFALFIFQYTTLQKFQVLKPAVRYVVSWETLSYIQSQVGLTMWDAMGFGLIASLFLLGVFFEIFRGRLSLLLRWVFVTDRRTVWALVGVSVVCVRFYFASGVLNWAGDGSSHMCYAWLASESFAQGDIPIWTNYLGGGSPYLQFYGFLFFYVVGLLDQVVGDLDSTIKLVLFSAHVLSGVGMFWFVRRLTGGRKAAFVAGLAYVLCVWHMQQVLVMGRFPLSLFYAFLPYPFYGFERVRLGQRDGVVIGGLSLGALAFVHPGYAFWATAALAFYMVIRVMGGRSRLTRRLWMRYAGALWALGILFGAYVTVPMWVERANVELEEITHASVPDPTWGHLFVWSNYKLQLFAYPGYDHWYGGYLGFSLLVLAGVGFGGVRMHRSWRSVIWAVGACLLVSFVLVLGYRWSFIRALELVKAFNAGRYLLFVTFFLSVMAGIGTRVVMQMQRVHAQRLITGILLILCVDLGTATFQHPYAQKDHTFLTLSDSFYEELRQDVGELPEGQIPNFRLSYPMGNMFDLLGIAWFTVNMQVPSYLTGYREGLPAQSLFCGPVQDLTNRILEDGLAHLGRHPELDYLLLGQYLLNTRLTYVMDSRVRELIRVPWRFDSPIVVAPSAQVFAFDETEDRVDRLKQMLHRMQVNVQTHTSAQILLAEGEVGEDLSTSPEVNVVSHEVWNQRVAYQVRVSEPCFARLTYAYYPYLGVSVNGEAVEAYKTAGGFVAVKLDAGVHQIELRPYLSPLRRFFLFVDVFIILGVGILWWRKRKSQELVEDV